MINIPNEVLIALDLLNGNGYEAYLIGGCIRDSLMGIEPKDYDITTNATPNEMLKIFVEYSIIPTGLGHGTITVLINKLPLEITTYKSNLLNKIGQDLKEDMAYRDFTINAIAMNKDSEIIDYCDGQNDLKRKIVRCVGDPDERFKEDGLRILRALRFASVLNFSIDEKTSKSIKENKLLLNEISVERIYNELTKMICGVNAKAILDQYSDVIAIVIPEIKAMIGFKQYNEYHDFDVWQHTLSVLENTPALPIMRWSALFHDIGKPNCFTKDENGIGHFYQHNEYSGEIARAIMNRLKFDNASKSNVISLVTNHMEQLYPSRKVIKRRLNKYGEDIFIQLIEFKKADIKGQSSKYLYRLDELDKVMEILNDILKEKECFSIKNLAINGKDLIELGYQGREVGKILNLLIENVIDEKVINDKDELVAYLQKR